MAERPWQEDPVRLLRSMFEGRPTISADDHQAMVNLATRMMLLEMMVASQDVAGMWEYLLKEEVTIDDAFIAQAAKAWATFEKGTELKQYLNSPVSRGADGKIIGDGMDDLLIAETLEAQGVMSIEETNDPTRSDVVQRVLRYLLGE